MIEDDLKASAERVGRLVPVLKDAHGNVIDGFHRLRVDPKWPSIKLDHATDPVQLSIARLIANCCRRKIPAKEISQQLEFIAQVTGWTPKQIASAMGMSYTWVMKYLPAEYKDKEMQARATQRVARPPGPEPVEKDELLNRLMKYYPMPLLDLVWQFVKEPAKRERVAYVLVGVLLDHAQEQKVDQDLLMKAIKMVR